jgi:hypothetical protein
VGPFSVEGAGKDGSAVRLDTVSPLGGRGTQNANALRSLGVAFGLVAAGLVVLATFMARLSCTTIDLSHDRLIGRSEGLFFLLSAGVMIIGAIASIRDRRAGWLLVLAGLAILGLTIYSATGSRSLVLDAIPGFQGAVHGELGPGLGISGIAGVLAAIGGCLVVSPTW